MKRPRNVSDLQRRNSYTFLKNLKFWMSAETDVPHSQLGKLRAPWALPGHEEGGVAAPGGLGLPCLARDHIGMGVGPRVPSSAHPSRPSALAGAEQGRAPTSWPILPRKVGALGGGTCGPGSSLSRGRGGLQTEWEWAEDCDLASNTRGFIFLRKCLQTFLIDVSSSAVCP